MKRRRAPESKVVQAGHGRDVLARLQGRPSAVYEFRLYIAGANLNSVAAIEHVRRLCKTLRPSRCDLDIIDLYQQPALAKRDDVVAAPALVKLFPLPRRTFIGDLSDLPRVFAGLGITTAYQQDVRTESEDK